MRETGDRAAQLHRALRLSYISIAWGLASGSAAVAIGLMNHSLAVVGVGLGLLADVTGSCAIVWRTHRERGSPHHADHAEAMASRIIVGALCVAAVALVAGTAHGLLAGTRPERSALAIASALANLAVLIPLGLAKRRLGSRLRSEALRGDGLLSLLGAAMAMLALIGLVLDLTLGWWWADPGAALLVAAIAAAEAVRIATSHESPATASL